MPSTFFQSRRSPRMAAGIAFVLSTLAYPVQAADPALSAPTPLGKTRLELASQAIARGAEGGADLVCPIVRDGTRVGTHRVTFTRQGDDLRVHARSEIVVKLAFIPVYRLDYDSRSVWRQGALWSMSARTDDNGTKTSVRVERDGSGALVSRSGGEWEPVSGPLYPTNHWNPGVIGAERVLNTITGALNSVTMTHLGVETLDGGGGPRPAHHFRYGGGLRADVWYDDRGRWMKLAFDGADGSRVEYLCDTPPREETAERSQ